MSLKNARQIIDAFPAHLKRKHRGRREVGPKDIADAQAAYLQKHLDRYYAKGWADGIGDKKRALDTSVY